MAPPCDGHTHVCLAVLILIPIQRGVMISPSVAAAAAAAVAHFFPKSKTKKFGREKEDEKVWMSETDNFFFLREEKEDFSTWRNLSNLHLSILPLLLLLLLL